MKKSLIALAVLAASGAAMAQSSVTLYGRAAINYTWDDYSSAKFQQKNGGLGGSRIGFRGVEDLGNGLKAGFVLEYGTAVDTGTGFTARQSFVSLAGGFGEVRFGRQGTVNDAFAGTYGGAHGTVWNNAGTAISSNGTWNNNVASYISPNLNGLKVTGQVATKEEDLSGNGKAYYGLAVDYANGPIGAGLAASKNGLLGSETVYLVGGSYDFGPVALLGGWEYDKNKDKKNAYSLGAKVPFGATTVRVTYSYQQEAGADARNLFANATGKAQGLGLGADYKLSKRSTVWAGYAYVKSKNADFDGSKSANQVSVGFDHWF